MASNISKVSRDTLQLTPHLLLLGAGIGAGLCDVVQQLTEELPLLSQLIRVLAPQSIYIAH